MSVRVGLIPKHFQEFPLSDGSLVFDFSLLTSVFRPLPSKVLTGPQMRKQKTRHLRSAIEQSRRGAVSVRVTRKKGKEKRQNTLSFLLDVLVNSTCNSHEGSGSLG